jgi:hypothetical protein
MSGNKKITLTVLVLVSLCLAACSPAGTPTGSGPDQAVVLKTQVAEALASTAAVQTGVANALAATQAVLASATPEFTFTPSLTPSLQILPTTSVPTVTVSVATNCRSGPTTVYSLLGILYVGEKAEVVGRSIYTDTMIIKLPSRPNVQCWLWAQHATVVGNTGGLPLIDVPPSPTPAPNAQADFGVIYASTINCSGQYKLKFKITNSGDVPWESNSVKATDQTTSEEQKTSYDDFPNLNSGCGLASDDLNLTAGETGTTMSGGFSANPAGHIFKATLRVCSLDGLDGTCVDKAITFTP